jgi:hypothetical protein
VLPLWVHNGVSGSQQQQQQQQQQGGWLLEVVLVVVELTGSCIISFLVLLV